MKIACQIQTTWKPEGSQALSRVYIQHALGGKVELWLPGQGRMAFDPGDAAVIGDALKELAREVGT